MSKERPETRAAQLLDEYIDSRLSGRMAPKPDEFAARCPQTEREGLMEAIYGVENVVAYHCDDHISDKLLDDTLAKISQVLVRRRLVLRINELISTEWATMSSDFVHGAEKIIATLGPASWAPSKPFLGSAVMNRGSGLTVTSKALLYTNEANLKLLESTLEKKIGETIALMDDLSAPVDLSVLAQRLCLIVQNVPLDPLDGCLITNGEAGIILLNSSVLDERRRRFTFGHEIGHAVLHSGQALYKDSSSQLDDFDAGAEMQANVFSSLLLMPSALLPSNFGATLPSLAAADELCEEYEVSLLASLRRLVRASNWGCALVVSKLGAIQWTVRSPFFQAFIPKQLHPDSLASQLFANEEWPCQSKAEWPAEMWCEGIDDESTIVEESRRVSNEYVYTLLLLVWKD
ncbi:ImmA/IrrE family metallo-endopeptidase [Capsulimonas corticalis]|uniref:ImmA/IrrE family metallo-endopeptidase n=1 Tax=Capsulimonas corticalis TaxID=2219043 RepID=UPI000F64B94F|nr:ImmA/IrrE family metallo-endopeptidase [Capsulimonas corticalis]